MLKLTKYEFRKNLTAPLIMLIVIGIMEIVFLCSLALGAETYVGLSFGLQTTILTFSYLIVLIFSITSYSSELKSKSSYMTFMAPVSTYKVIGAKLLTALIMAVIFGATMFILFPTNVMLIGVKYDGLKSIFDMFKYVIESIGYSFTELLAMLVTTVLELMVIFYLVVVLAYLAITLSSTVLQDKKFKGFVSAIIFFIIFAICMWIDGILPTLIDEPVGYFEAFVAILPSYLFFVACIVGGFFATGKILKEKVSL